MLLHLASHGTQIVFTPTTAIAKKTGTARSAVARAIAALEKRSLIRYDPGNQAANSRFDLLFLIPVRMPCPQRGQLELTSNRTGDLLEDSPRKGHVLLEDSSGAANTALTAPAAGVSIDFDLDDLIDRVLQTKEADNPEHAAAATFYLHEHMRTIAGFPDAPPPDPRVVAQFLAIADWPTTLHDLERIGPTIWPEPPWGLRD